METVRVVACGSRRWHDHRTVEVTLRRIRERLMFVNPFDKPTLVHGGAKGADRLAAEVAEEMGWTIEGIPAHWSREGKKAGYNRNRRMFEKPAHLCVAFWDGTSNGTMDTIKVACRKGVEVVVVPSRYMAAYPDPRQMDLTFPGFPAWDDR